MLVYLKIFDKEDKVQKEVDKVNEQLTELQDKAENTEEDALGRFIKRW